MSRLQLVHLLNTTVTGHFPTCLHNFAWCEVVNHDRMTTYMLHTKSDPNFSCLLLNFTCAVEISSGSVIYLDVVNHLTAARHRLQSDRPTASTLFTVYVITRSRASRNYPYNAAQIYGMQKVYCPGTLKFSQQRCALLRMPATHFLLRIIIRIYELGHCR